MCSGPCANFWIRASTDQVYYIQVGTELGFSGERAEFQLSLKTVTPPKNDLRRKAIKIKKKLPLTLKANVAGAFGEPGEEQSLDQAGTVWYHFKPVKGGTLRLDRALGHRHV